MAGIDGFLLLTVRKFADAGGHFFEVWCQVSLLQAKVFGVALDLRPGSAKLGKHHAIELCFELNRIVHYKVANPYLRRATSIPSFRTTSLHFPALDRKGTRCFR